MDDFVFVTPPTFADDCACPHCRMLKALFGEAESLSAQNAVDALAATYADILSALPPEHSMAASLRFARTAFAVFKTNRERAPVLAKARTN